MTRILIADDHAVVRSGVRAILTDRSDWEVVAEAEDGQQAVELADETNRTLPCSTTNCLA